MTLLVTLMEFLPCDELEKIMSLPPPRLRNLDDAFLWRHSADGSFSSNSADLVACAYLLATSI